MLEGQREAGGGDGGGQRGRHVHLRVPVRWREGVGAGQGRVARRRGRVHGNQVSVLGNLIFTRVYIRKYFRQTLTKHAFVA